MKKPVVIYNELDKDFQFSEIKNIRKNELSDDEVWGVLNNLLEEEFLRIYNAIDELVGKDFLELGFFERDNENGCPYNAIFDSIDDFVAMLNGKTDFKMKIYVEYGKLCWDLYSGNQRERFIVKGITLEGYHLYNDFFNNRGNEYDGLEESDIIEKIEKSSVYSRHIGNIILEKIKEKNR